LDKEYKEYLDDAKNFETGWDYLKHYNIRDVEVMIKPIHSMRKMWADLGMDMFRCISLSTNVSTLKHKMLYDDFDVNANYNIDGLDQSPYFEPTLELAMEIVEGYNEQDENVVKKGVKQRNPTNNVKPEEVLAFFQKHKCCYLCNAAFIENLNPALDRIDNSKGHSTNNVEPCCLYCNRVKSDKDKNMIQFKIQMRRYCIKNNLPMALTDEITCLILRDSINGSCL
jgi:hypothetical protein